MLPSSVARFWRISSFSAGDLTGFDLAVCSNLNYSQYIHIYIYAVHIHRYTHTHTYIYIYIYIYKDRYKERLGPCLFWFYDCALHQQPTKSRNKSA